MTRASAPRSAEAVPGQGTRTSEGCPVGELFAMLGQPHMLEVLHVFFGRKDRPVRFGELQRELDLSPRTLSNRLKTLVEAGLLVRRRYRELPPRVDYEVTDKARELSDLFEAMEAWARHNTLDTVGTVSVVGRA